MIIEGRNALSLRAAGPIDCIALGSPHFSDDECRKLLALAKNIPFIVPAYVCIGRHTLADLQVDGADKALKALGAELVIDTCVVVTPILPDKTSGVMMTNSAKFAHYAEGNTGYYPIFGTLSDCVKSAQEGRVIWECGLWG
jgi:predicted aconitase